MIVNITNNQNKKKTVVITWICYFWHTDERTSEVFGFGVLKEKKKSQKLK